MKILRGTDIEEMEAGREIDILIAEKIMGLKLWYGDPTGFNQPENMDYWRTDYVDDDGEYYVLCPYYSTSMAFAWLIVEEMEKRDVWFSLESVIPNSDPIVYEVMFDRCAYACEFTAPLAICKAALLALEDIK